MAQDEYGFEAPDASVVRTTTAAPTPTPTALPNAPAPTPAPEADEYGFNSSPLDSAPKQALSTSLYGAVDKNPDEQANVIKLAQRAQLPPDVVGRNQEQVSRDQQVTEAQSLPDTHAGTAKFLSDPVNASVAHDDIDNLKKTEDVVRDHTFAENTWNAVNVGLANLNKAATRIPSLLFNAKNLPENLVKAGYRDFILTPEERASSDSLGQAESTTGFPSWFLGGGVSAAEIAPPDWLTNNPLSKVYDDIAKTHEVPALHESIVDKLKSGDISGAGEGLWYQFLANAPLQAVSLGLALAGHPEAGAGLVGTTTAADVNAEALNAGVSPAAAAANAGAHGVIMAQFEKLGVFDALHGWESTIARQYGKAFSQEVMQEFANNLLVSFGKGAGEGAAMQVAQDISSFITGVDPSALEDTGKKALETGVIFGGIAAGSGLGGATFQEAAKLTMNSKRAEIVKNTFLKMGQAAEESKVKERLPDAHREFSLGVTAKTPIENTFIPVEEFQTLFQGKKKSPADVANKLGAADSYAQAVQSGGLVQVKTADLISRLEPEEYKALADHVKFTPDGQTVAEAKAASEQLKTDVTAVAQDAQTDPTKTFADQLRAAGADPHHAELLGGIANLAQQEGLDPKQFFDELNLNISREKTPSVEGKTFDQSGTPVADMSIEARAERAKALGFNTDRVLYHGTGRDISSFNPSVSGTLGEGVYLTSDPNQAAHYADMVETNNIFEKAFEPARYKAERERLQELGVEKPELNKQVSKNLLDTARTEVGGANILPVVIKEGPIFDIENAQDMLDLVKKSGFKTEDELFTFLHDSRKSLNGFLKDGGYVGAKAGYETVIFDPKNIRSTSASFTNADSADILHQAVAGESPRGQIRIGSRSIDISLFESADPSTTIHEFGHLYLEVLNKLAAREGASERVVADHRALLDWLGVKDAASIETEHHEKLANGFMDYVAEGKAPTKELRGVFERFKLWVLANAHKLANLGVKFSPEVRDVFDRILAGKDQVEKEAQAPEYGPLFSDPIAMGMNEKQALAYRRATQEAKDSASRELTSRLMDDAKKKQSAEYAAKREEVEKEITHEANQSNTYQALAVLQKHTNADGSPLPEGSEPFKIDVSAIHPDERREFPRGIFAKDGIDPNDAAHILGFSSGDELLDTLKAAPKKEDLIKQKTDAAMSERFPDLLESPRLPEAAVEALHNGSRSEKLRLELEHLASNNMPTLKDVIRRVTKRPPTVEAVRALAEKTVGEVAVGELRPSVYQRAEVKAAKEAGEFLAKGDIDKAFEAKKRELLSHELYRAAVSAKEQIAHIEKRFQKIATVSDEKASKTRDTDIVTAAKAVLSQFWVAPLTDKTPEQALAKVKQYDTDTYNSLKVLVDQTQTLKGDYKALSFDDLSGLHQTVEALWSVAKTSKELTTGEKKITLESARGEISDKVNEYSTPADRPGFNKAVTKWEKTRMGLLGLKAALTRVEFWASAMDVEKDGPFRRLIFDPISEAVTKYKLERVEKMEKLRGIFKENAESFKGDKAIEAPELKYTFENKAELLGALTHIGNESNFRKLLVGRGWGSAFDDGTLDRSKWDTFIDRMHKTGVLTKSDYDNVQGIWDLFEETKAGAQKAHKGMYGYYFGEITAKPIETPFGEYKGGYVPAKVDTDINLEAATRETREKFEQTNQSFQFPTTGKGFTKSRVEAYAEPLSLDLNKLAGHLDGVLRFTHIEPRVKEVLRLINDRDLREQLEGHDPSVVKDLLVPWLQRSATQQLGTPSTTPGGRFVDKVISYGRRNSAMQLMAGNVKVALHILVSSVASTTLVKPRHLGEAVLSSTRDFKGVSRDMLEKSEYMRSVQDSHNDRSREAINEILVNPSVFEKAKDFSTAHSHFLQSAVQGVVSPVVWTAGYNQAIESGRSESEAVRDADQVVRKTQHTFGAENVASYETGSEVQRSIFQMSGYFNLLANLNASEMTRTAKEVGLRKGAGKLFMTYLTGLALPAILTELTASALQGKKDKDEDDDQVLDALVGSQTRMLTSMVPLGGQLLNAGAKAFESKQTFGSKFSFSPVISVLESAVKAPGEVYQSITDDQKDPKRGILDTLSLIGIASGLPLGAFGKPVGYLMDVNSGEAQPSGPVDVTRGLLTGRKE